MAGRRAIFCLSLLGVLCFTGAVDVQRMRNALDKFLTYDPEELSAPPEVPPMEKEHPAPPEVPPMGKEHPAPPELPPPDFHRPPPLPKGCFIDGVLHKPGPQRFTAMQCTGLCRCRGTGAISCVSLCPPLWPPACNKDEELVFREVPAWKTGHCTCKRSYCEEKKDLEVRSIETKKA